LAQIVCSFGMLMTDSDTYQSEFFGAAPAGKRVEMSGTEIDRFDEGGTMVMASSRARLAG
jgi:predicted ester cyclase